LRSIVHKIDFQPYITQQKHTYFGVKNWDCQKNKLFENLTIEQSIRFTIEQSFRFLLQLFQPMNWPLNRQVGLPKTKKRKPVLHFCKKKNWVKNSFMTDDGLLSKETSTVKFRLTPTHWKSAHSISASWKRHFYKKSIQNVDTVIDVCM
jgi:hypothetical protein